MKTLIILNFVTRELWKFNFNKENFSKENFNKENFSKENFSKENFSKENFGKENFGKVLNFAEVEKFQTLPKLKKLKKVPNFAEVESKHITRSPGFVIRELTPKKYTP